MSDVARTYPQLKPFKPGQSGNPGGRPKGFAYRIKKRCGKEGQKLVEGWTLIAWGSDAECEKFFGCKMVRTVRDRHDAMVELANRGFGRPLTLQPDDPIDKATEVIINLPQPPSELVGRRVVTGMFRVEEESSS